MEEAECWRRRHEEVKGEEETKAKEGDDEAEQEKRVDESEMQNIPFMIGNSSGPKSRALLSIHLRDWK